MADKKRPYRMKRRAELEAETRRRITESAVELHGSVGPAHTSISAVAERAGVQRSTVYRHFPDEEALFGACSAHWLSANPPPDISRWTEADPDRRLAAALEETYAYYRRSGGMLDRLIRDEPAMPIVEDLLGGYREMKIAATEALMRGRGLRGRARNRMRAAIGHALSFPTWRQLVGEQRLDDAEAADLMRRLVSSAV